MKVEVEACIPAQDGTNEAEVTNDLAAHLPSISFNNTVCDIADQASVIVKQAWAMILMVVVIPQQRPVGIEVALADVAVFGRHCGDSVTVRQRS